MQTSPLPHREPVSVLTGRDSNRFQGKERDLNLAGEDRWRGWGSGAGSSPGLTYVKEGKIESGSEIGVSCFRAA